ncbi:uncharacterized protein MAM_04185 [Metarhizium album ARSEF 1941]|uniref:Uncharacterized protein n=1 Tax=Metarhizium album (strain ARSEF 1941) TaxID=1081103 RepID=A0A0B2WP33_METAS|nr:uncharacterized protein MAM_04185 [Metarhizium album ARSEF 1941]KHN97796.1 hypothetical protein MAM_04185 [Metarhizium album ARSEF 1941]
MLLYFQPPIFAVQPATCIQHVVWAPPAAYCAAVYTAPAAVHVYTPMVSGAAALSRGAQRPSLRIRIIYYGHGHGHGRGRDRDPERDGQGGGALWCRAVDATYADGVPTGPRLREDISRWARVHDDLAGRASAWREASIAVAGPGSAGPVRRGRGRGRADACPGDEPGRRAGRLLDRLHGRTSHGPRGRQPHAAGLSSTASPRDGSEQGRVGVLLAALRCARLQFRRGVAGCLAAAARDRVLAESDRHQEHRL